MPFNFLIRWLLRSPLHFLMSSNTLLLEYTGKKSGKNYQIPLNYVKIEYRFVVTSQRERIWWRNFREAQLVQVRIRGNNCAAQALTIEDTDELITGFREYFAVKPDWGKHYDVRVDESGPKEEDLFSLSERAVLINIQLDG